MEGAQEMESKHGRESQGIVLENNHVHSVYEKTSKHFADLEQRAWPKVKRFLQDLQPGSLVADVGCGNGRYLSINKNICVIGSDRCQGLVDIAGVQGQEVLVSDNLFLPFRGDTFDAVISISVIHHFSTRRRRCKAVCELARILKPGGKVLIYVMAMEQHLRKFESQDVLVPWNFNPGSKTNKGSLSQRSSSTSLSEQDNSDDNYQGSAWGDSSSLQSSISRTRDKNAKLLQESGYASDHNLDSLHISKNAKSGASAAVSLVTATNDSYTDYTQRLKKQADFKHRSSSLSETLKSKFFGLLGKDNRSKSLDCPNVEKQKTQWHKDMDYKKLVDYIMMEEAELLNMASLDPDGCVPVFAVREFPGSSQNAAAKPSVDLSDSDRTFRKVSSDNGSNKMCNGEGEPSLINSGHLTDAAGDTLSNSQNVVKNKCHSNCQSAQNGHKMPHNERPDSCPLSCHCCAGLDSQNDTSKVVGVDVDMMGLHNWVATTTKAIEVMQAQVKSGLEPKQDKPSVFQNSKVEAIWQYKNRMASNKIHSSPDSVSSNGSSDYENEVSICAKQSSDTCSISSDSWSDLDNMDGNMTDGQLTDQLDQRDDVCDNGNESPEETQENGQNFKDEPSLASPAYHRYYHVFKEDELCDLINKYVKSLKVVKSYYDHGNWCVIAEKLHR